MMGKKRTLVFMRTLSIAEARKNISQLIDQANETHEPIQITGKRNNAVLVSEEDWRSIHGTVYLTSILGMKEPKVEGLKTSVSEPK